ncbi:MAG: sulfite exporter TauE/SafE family protein [Enterovibrio sp.]
MFELFEPSSLIMLASIAFIAGFVDAVAGGGGMLTVPALLSFGLPAHLALGTNKLAATFASATAAYTYYRKKLFSPHFWLHAFLATLLGAIIGTLFVDQIPTQWLEKILPLVIVATAIYTLLQPQINNDSNALPEGDRYLKQKQWGQGLALGFYDGMAGPGTGAFWVVIAMSMYKLNMLIASGLAKAMNFTSNIASLATFIILGHVYWPLGLLMGACLMCGAYLGARSAIRFGAKFIRPIFITVVMALAIKLAYQAWF